MNKGVDRSHGSPASSRAAAHLVAALLFAIALFFTAWFLLTNIGLLTIFGHLSDPWRAGGGGFDWAGLAWALLAVALFLVIGWFYLEGLEHYLPFSAALPLALLFGMGLVGFVLECLAIPFALMRSTIAFFLGGLLTLLAVRAWLAVRRPPTNPAGGEAGLGDHLLRRSLARQAYRERIVRPRGLFGWTFATLAVSAIATIAFFIFWHALLYPVVYWDALLHYVGYARWTFIEGGFPAKVTAQVCMGLAAQYPHLYSVLGAGVATAADLWSELPQRLICPLAGLGTTLLVYHSALRMTRHVNFALAVTLLYRSIPLGIAYDQYASDYALALLFGVAFLYLALVYIETALPAYLAAMTLLVGLGMHLNYLMGILWAPWLTTVLCAHLGFRRELRSIAAPGAPWTVAPHRPTLGELLRSMHFWAPFLIAVAIGSTWYIRNWIVAGNPVYAFFYNFFGGENINPDVMDAAAREWRANGAGIGRLGDTLGERIRASWTFFTGAGEPFWRPSYRTSPILMAFSVGGLLVWVGRMLASIPRRPAPGVAPDPALRFGWVLAVLTFALLAYHYLLAPYYLYQIVIILPCLALWMVFAWPWWRLQPWRTGLGTLVFWIALVPGIAMSMMGFKIVGTIALPGGRVESPMALYPLRRPLPKTEHFYRWRYGEDPLMWDYVNKHLAGQQLLTHENRHLVFHPSIALIHLDDLPMQALWDAPEPAERVRRLLARGIRHYLYVPNEDACATNKRMGAYFTPSLHAQDLLDPDAIVSRLRDGDDPLSNFLRDRLPSGLLRPFEADERRNDAAFRAVLADQINRTLDVDWLEADPAIAQMTWSEPTRAAIDASPASDGDPLRRLQRRLLDETFADAIAPRQPDWLDLGLARRVYAAGANQLFELLPPPVASRP